MQSVSLKTLFISPRPAAGTQRNRQFSYLLNAFMAATLLLPCALTAHAQDTQTVPAAAAPEKFDLGVGGFYQITNASNGNSIREDTTSSGGALVNFRQPLRPWFGYEVGVGYTKFYESYNKNTVKLQSNVTDLAVSYLLQSPTYYGVGLSATLGGGVIVFSPLSQSKIDIDGILPANLGSQLLPEFVYSVGLNYPVYGHFGVRGQFRGLIYKTPDFHQDQLDTHTLRSTVEPTISVYYRF